MRVHQSKSVKRFIDEYMEICSGIGSIFNNIDNFVDNSMKLSNIIMDDMLAYLSKKYTGKEFEDAVLANEIAFLMESASGLSIQNEFIHYMSMKLFKLAKVIDADDFRRSNRYLNDIKLDKCRESSKFELCEDKTDAWALFNYNTGVIDSRLAYMNVPRLAVFNKDFVSPCLNIKDTNEMWMSITPNEVYTMEKAISKSFGKVLTLGCGIGYFAYMSSLKEDVESVTIIENDQEVIDMFNECILPQFKTKDKIKLIKADAIDYMHELEDGLYDYCFADIWIGAIGIKDYFKVKEIGRNFKKMVIDYWIEDAFMMGLIDYVIPEVMSSISHVNFGGENSDYVHRLFKNVEIQSDKDIVKYLNVDRMLKMVTNTKIIYNKN